jgi:lysophospholipase L1-like esterase
MSDSPKPETPAESLARSAFGFAIVALIPAVITWVGFLLAPSSPDPIFDRIRLAIIIGFGIITLLLLFAAFQLFRIPPDKLLPVSERIAGMASNKWIAIVFVFILLEINLMAFPLLYNVAPSITNPSKFLMVCWSLLLVGIIFTVNRQAFTDWLARTRGVWVTTGLLVVSIGIIGLLFALNNLLLKSTGLDDALRGGLDYRELTFYEDDEPVPSAQDFWREQAQTRVRWSPYTYWVVDEFHGNFINVDANGLRFTHNFAANDSQIIHVYGGSTVWGEGARDAYTIPGHLARLLSENDTPQSVLNFGQTGYVSTQDVIWFQLQLTQGNVPDVAIFYEGFNDVLSAWSQGLTGITLQENMRLNDAEAGRILRAGQPVLRLPNETLQQYDMSLANIENATTESIAERWFSNVELVNALGEAYGVEIVFVWQPAIMFKSPQTPTEQAIIARWENERAGLFELYMDVDSIIRQRVQEYDNIVLLSDLFAGNEQTIFHDLVHITEIGNSIVAEAILPQIMSQLDE